jgi:hypothetical protein
MRRRYDESQGVREVTVEGDAGHVGEARKPPLDLALVHGQQASPLERLQGRSYVRGDLRRRASDDHRPESEDRRLARADVRERSGGEEREPEEKRAAGRERSSKRERPELLVTAQGQPRHASAIRSRDRGHRVTFAAVKAPPTATPGNGFRSRETHATVARPRAYPTLGGASSRLPRRRA